MQTRFPSKVAFRGPGGHELRGHYSTPYTLHRPPSDPRQTGQLPSFLPHKVPSLGIRSRGPLPSGCLLLSLSEAQLKHHLLCVAFPCPQGNTNQTALCVAGCQNMLALLYFLEILRNLSFSFVCDCEKSLANAQTRQRYHKIEF